MWGIAQIWTVQLFWLMVVRFCVSDVFTMEINCEDKNSKIWSKYMEKFCNCPPQLQTCLDLVSPQMFWSISNQYPDLVTRLYVQIRPMGNFGFSACVLWTIRADESLCFVCKEAKDDLYHFLFDCSYFGKKFDSSWSNLEVKAANSSPTDGSQISAFINP